MTASIASTRTLTCLIASHRDALAQELAAALRAQGHEPVVRSTAAGAGQALTVPGIDAVVIDGALPGIRWDRLQAALTPDPDQAPESLDVVERRHIAATLRHTGGNRRNAAAILGIARSTLLAKIRKYGLDRGPADRA